MADFLAFGNESVNLGHVERATLDPAGVLLLHVHGERRAVSLESPDAERVAAIVGLGDRLAAVRAEAKARAKAGADTHKAAEAPKVPARPARV